MNNIDTAVQPKWKSFAVAGLILLMLVSLCLLFCTGCGSDSSSDSSKSDSSKSLNTSKLSVGTAYEMDNKLKIKVQDVETGLKNYDGSTFTRVKVKYVNNGKEGASYNSWDWKAEDKQGSQTDTDYYSEAKNELGSGTLAAGGKISGNLYFEGTPAKILYYDNYVWDDTPTLTWVVK